ncbi:MAG: site-specific DNA-methyltransferase [Desulfobacteraceae bacterium]|jgi:adenine-specific DNA-methyltransferase|nr:site-specific DNA-methyltransferase [Desulfobacteraceae bacterium]
MIKKQKLELTWIGKENRPRLEPRILMEDPEKSYHAEHKISENDIFDNMLIHGDNLLALKALEQDFTGKIKCIYIDPPYNTGSAFEHYDDGLEHSIWLSLMKDRLELLRNLLSDDGSIWINVDDNEAHYLKVLCDEIFSRKCFIANVVWQKRTSPDSRLGLSTAHDSILVYGKSGNAVHTKFNKIFLTEDQRKNYKNPDNDPRGPWVSTDFSAQGYRPNQMYAIMTPAGVEYTPPGNRCWANIETVFNKLVDDNRIWFGKYKKSRPRVKNFLSEAEGTSCWTWWTNSDVGHNQEAKKEINSLFGTSKAFDTPKPERLIERIIHVATNPNDLILDSFLGSGTTAAVAHKMGRRWIGVELGDHCETHCLPRLKKVVDGDDSGGITKAVNWKGGGGFRYYRLGPSLIKEDEWGNPVINPEFNGSMLAEAMCKIEGFNYVPSEEKYWIHGQSTEADYIYITTQFMSKEMLTRISDEVGAERSLLICCTAFRCKADEFTNLTLKKIPNAVLQKCEWGKDDYSLEIQNLPETDAVPEQEPEKTGGKSDTKSFETQDKQMGLPLGRPGDKK